MKKSQIILKYPKLSLSFKDMSEKELIFHHIKKIDTYLKKKRNSCANYMKRKI